jgi:hypothetical protein
MAKQDASQQGRTTVGVLFLPAFEEVLSNRSFALDSIQIHSRLSSL